MNKVPVNVKGWSRAAPAKCARSVSSELSMDTVRLTERQEVVCVSS
jgi:hypothetical protein